MSGKPFGILSEIEGLSGGKEQVHLDVICRVVAYYIAKPYDRTNGPGKDMHMAKRNGPVTDPWGTPVESQ